MPLKDCSPACRRQFKYKQQTYKRRLRKLTWQREGIKDRQRKRSERKKERKEDRVDERKDNGD
jgi:hypothetical protein